MHRVLFLAFAGSAAIAAFFPEWMEHWLKGFATSTQAMWAALAALTALTTRRVTANIRAVLEDFRDG